MICRKTERVTLKKAVEMVRNIGFESTQSKAFYILLRGRCSSVLVHFYRFPIYRLSIVCKFRFPFPYISLWWYLQIGEQCKESEIELVSIYCPLLLLLQLSPVVYLLFALWGRKVRGLKQ